MENLNREYAKGDSIKISEFLTLEIEDMKIEIEEGEVSVWFMCYMSNHKEGVAEDSRLYSLESLQDLLNIAFENNEEKEVEEIIEVPEAPIKEFSETYIKNNSMNEYKYISCFEDVAILDNLKHETFEFQNYSFKTGIRKYSFHVYENGVETDVYWISFELTNDEEDIDRNLKLLQIGESHHNLLEMLSVKSFRFSHTNYIKGIHYKEYNLV